MDIESLRTYCLSFPETTEKLQWGHDICFRVRGKMFTVAALEFGSVPQLCFKCTPEAFAELIEREGIAPAPYVGRYRWVGLESLHTLPTRELRDLIANSYALVAAKLPKKHPGTRTPNKPPQRPATPTRKGRRSKGKQAGEVN